MAISLIDDSLILLQMICVIIVFAYLLTRSRLFAEVLEGHPTIRTQVLMTLVFGAISIYGTISGREVLGGALVNVRDLGPMVAGLTCGPWVGLGAGLIGAAYRMTLGGFTVYSCSLATVLAGLLGGLIWLANRRQFVGIRIAVEFAVMMEGLHMLLAILMDPPLAMALAVVSAVAFPMILANAVGMLIFSFIITNLQKERKVQAERDDYLREIERKNTELEIASEIQKSFLPSEIPPVPGFEIAAASVPAKEVGGDFFDVIPFAVMPLKDHTIGVLIADVSGKGIPAALFMALSRVIMRVSALWHKRPADAMREANTIIANDARSGMFVTLFYAVIDEEKQMFTYANAGHNPPMVYRSGPGTIEELEATGIALGAVEDSEYSQEECYFLPGDIVVLYTDGVTEACNEAGDMFGEGRLRELIVGNHSLNAGEFVNTVLREVGRFSAGCPQSDDITIMVIRVLAR